MTMSSTLSAGGALPVELTSFVGRRQELAAIRPMLGECRLVTLTGMGGVGKTRLALRTAMELRRQFADGVWFVELASLRDPLLLPHTVAKALHLEQVSPDPTGDLADWLEHRHLLMVLDNCEHLADACATLIGKLLAAAPELRILATSRHVLGAEGEQLVAVPPLSTPEDSVGLVGDASHYESVALLVDRARAMDPDFAITEDNRDAVLDLCRRLDGLPLAIELAAVWLRTLSPAQIVGRLDDRFNLLSTGRRGGPARQQALDAAVAWSFDLCSPEERLLWSRLSVFSGGFDLEAAEEVCSGEGIDRYEVLPLLAGLVDKSIVIREDDDAHKTSWFRMLETIREYGVALVDDSGQTRAIQLRHRDHYRTLATQFAEEFFTPRQAGWFIRLRREHGNLRAAIDFCLSEPREATAALEIAAPVWNWWFAGFLQEGYRNLLRALELATDPTGSRAYALFATSNLAIHLSDFDRALAMLAEGAELADGLGDELLGNRIKQCQGHALLHRGDPAAAIPLLEEAYAGAQRLGQPREEFRSLHLLSLATGLVGDPQDRELSRRAVEVAEQHAAESSKAWALWGLGLAECRAGDFPNACESLRESLRMFQAMRNVNGMGFCVQGLSWCAAFSSPDQHAARLLGAAYAVWRDTGGNFSSGTYLQRDQQSLELVRESLGNAEFEAAFADGATYSVDQAVAMALGNPAGLGPPSGNGLPKAKTAHPGRLTQRQWEIAGLLAEGLSNKEIAARLVISQRTAETHVEHIFIKLGFRSRAQVSGWMAEQRDVERRSREPQLLRVTT
jgi:predicted ATPase/DNA-binding CsgD family transcriptional regulator